MANEVEIVVTGSDRTGSLWSRLRSDFGSQFKRIGQTAAREGREAGQRFSNNLRRELRANGQKVTDAVQTVLTGSLSGALKGPAAGPAIVGALAATLTAAAPVLGAALGGALTLGFGAVVVGLSTAGLFHVEKINKDWSDAEQKRARESNKQAEKLREQWRGTFRDIIDGVKEASQPLLPVLDTVRKVLKNVGEEFKPVLETALALTAGPLKGFIEDLGAAFLELKPALVPMMEAFGVLLETIGPQLPALFSSISDALIELSQVVIENKDFITAVFLAILYVIPLTIEAISGLIGFFRTLMMTSMNTFSTISSVVLSWADTLLGAIATVLGSLALIPGPMQASLQSASEAVRESQATIRGWKADVEALPKTIELQLEISDLETKLRIAKRELQDPNLTKTRKAEIKAQIAQLEAAVARARAALNSVQSRTVTLTVNTLHTRNGPPRTALAHGGIVGALGLKKFQDGGVAGSTGATALVGEQGPEIVNLPVGSTVTPAGSTRNMMNGNSWRATSMAFKSAMTMVNPVREVAKAVELLAREIVTLREALTKSTGGIFAQERALSSYQAAIDNASKALKKNHRTLSLGTEKGRANRQALLDMAEAAHDVVGAMDDLNRSPQAIYDRMKKMRAEFIRTARSFGLTSRQARDLADRYGLSPSAVKAAVRKRDKDEAYNKKIEKKKKEEEKKAAGKATGGIAGGWTLVGEQGPELARLPFGSQVTPTGGTRNLLMSGGSNAPTPVVLEIHSGGSRLDDLLVEILRKAVRSRGGNVQIVLGKG